jgi:hypothetical protein
LLAAQEGAKELQKAKVQEATKLVKAKVDKKKEAKKKKKAGKGKEETSRAKPRLEIPEYVKQSVKKEREKQKKKAAAKLPKATGMIQVAESILPQLEQFRSKGPILWDPRVLKDATLEMGAVREKSDEHVTNLTEVIWSQRTQPTQREWLLFQFGVSVFCFVSTYFLS